MRLLRWIKERERARLLDDVPDSHRSSVGEIYDILDEGLGLYGSFIGLRVASLIMAVFYLFAVALVIAVIVFTTVHIEEAERPKTLLATEAAFVIYSFITSVRAVRRHNRRRQEGRANYEMMASKGEDAHQLNEASLRRKFAGYAEWPVWVIHAAVLLWITYTTLKHFGLLGW